MIRSQKIRDSARDEECRVNSPICNYNPETVVWAHSNYGEDGKGKGLKANDIFGCFACACCHDWLDGRVRINPSEYSWSSVETMKNYYFHRGMKRSWLRLIEKGLVIIK